MQKLPWENNTVRPRARRRLVRRRDAKSLEHESGIERLFGRSRFCNRGWLRGLQHRIRNSRLDFVAIDALRMYGTAAHLRSGAAHRRHGALLEHGQARAHLPNRGRLRPRSGRDLRPRWHGSYGTARGFQLGCEPGLAKAARRLFESGIRTETGRSARSREARTARDSRRAEKAGGAEEAASGGARTRGV